METKYSWILRILISEPIKNEAFDVNLIVSIGALVVTVISVVVAVKALGVANKTLEKTEEIAANQMWIDLVSEYSTPEFGEALKAISDFYIDDCGKKISNIQKAYRQRCDVECRKNSSVPISKSLRFQRRMVSYYYWKLDLFIKEHGKFKKKLKQYFNREERNLIAIVYEMNKVDIGFRKLTNDNEDYIGLLSADKESQILSHLSDLYEELRRL